MDKDIALLTSIEADLRKNPMEDSVIHNRLSEHLIIEFILGEISVLKTIIRIIIRRQNANSAYIYLEQLMPIAPGTEKAWFVLTYYDLTNPMSPRQQRKEFISDDILEIDRRIQRGLSPSSVNLILDLKEEDLCTA